MDFLPTGKVSKASSIAFQRLNLDLHGVSSFLVFHGFRECCGFDPCINVRQRQKIYHMLHNELEGKMRYLRVCLENRGRSVRGHMSNEHCM